MGRDCASKRVPIALAEGRPEGPPLVDLVLVAHAAERERLGYGLERLRR
jgi:hypothetical protein